jgi:hypothetical protein
MTTTSTAAAGTGQAGGGASAQMDAMQKQQEQMSLDSMKRNVQMAMTDAIVSTGKKVGESVKSAAQ